MFKLVLEKAEKPEIKLPTSAGSLKKKENSRKTSTIYFCFIDYAKAFDYLDHKKLENLFSFQSQRKEMPKNVESTAQLHSSHMLAK